MINRYKKHFTLILITSCLFGCGGSAGPADMGGEEGSKVAVLVEDLNEVKHNAKKMADFFSVKPSSTDAKKMNTMTFYVKGKPTVSGSTATCNIQIEKQDGTPIGEMEWNFEKLADAWKIKAAPLP